MDPPRLVQVIYGEGAGKTTMAIGKAIRAHGNSLKVAIIQFMKPGTAWWEIKNPEIGEVNALRQLGIQVYSYGREEFVHKPTLKDCDLAREALAKAISLLSSMDVIVLDELLNAISFGLLGEEEILDVLDKLNETELIMTGRVLPEEIRSRADLVTKVVSEIHPFENGVKGRKGFEY